jgi:hypothetical protein
MLNLKSRTYAGVGNRDTPLFYLNAMTRIASILEIKAYVLRSGGADGADTAFYNGLTDKCNSEIYLPWDGFNNMVYKSNIPIEAFRIAENFKSDFSNLPPAIQKLYARNVQQVLGKDLNDPCRFLICYTRDGYTGNKSRSVKTGGTKLAIDIAADLNIPIINLKRNDHYNRMADYFNKDNYL